jgi:hypothetical protein
MNYGPGYTMWQEMLRERAERRHARYLAKRAAAASATEPSGGTSPPRKRGRPRANPPTGAADTVAAPTRSRRNEPP